MKRTRKWAFVAQEATRLSALGLTQSEVARRLGVDRATVYRWVKAGKLEDHRGKTTGSVAVPPGQTPAQWAAAVRGDYSLDATDEQLLALAEIALAVSRDERAAANVRMLAAGRFQALVRQLALVARGARDSGDSAPDAAPQPAVPPVPAGPVRVPRRPLSDPRTLLMAVK